MSSDDFESSQEMSISGSSSAMLSLSSSLSSMPDDGGSDSSFDPGGGRKKKGKKKGKGKKKDKKKKKKKKKDKKKNKKKKKKKKKKKRGKQDSDSAFTLSSSYVPADEDIPTSDEFIPDEDVVGGGDDEIEDVLESDDFLSEEEIPQRGKKRGRGGGAKGRKKAAPKPKKGRGKQPKNLTPKDSVIPGFEYDRPGGEPAPAAPGGAGNGGEGGEGEGEDGDDAAHRHRGPGRPRKKRAVLPPEILQRTEALFKFTDPYSGVPLNAGQRKTKDKFDLIMRANSIGVFVANERSAIEERWLQLNPGAVLMSSATQVGVSTGVKSAYFYDEGIFTSVPRAEHDNQ